MGKRGRKKRAIQLPPELQGLAPRISETGEVELGVGREAWLRFLERLRRGEKGL
ncbi:MAG: hypothetical protein KatS3mg025_0247 [Bacteroidia bacterium]|nr:MAG: hypothetical protein KatS3mg025_0247 [Bacteroidia bacterium]